MDPEFRKEFEEQQKKGVLGTGASGGNPLQSFDMAGWMAGQTSGQSSESGPVTSGRDKEEGNGGNAGGGRGKRRRG